MRAFRMMQSGPGTDPQNKPKIRRTRLLAGVGLILVGVLVLVGVSGYYGFGLYNTAKLDDLNASVQGPVGLPELPAGQTEIHGALMPDGSFKPIHTVVKDVDSFITDENFEEYVAPESVPSPSPVQATFAKVEGGPPTPEPVVEPPKAVAPPTATAEEPAVAVLEEPAGITEPLDGGALVSSYNSLYPGYNMHPKYWDNPLLAGADVYEYGVIQRPDGFLSLSASNALSKGSAPDATHIRIPSIGVDSAVTNLAILNLGDSRQYETPNKVVGRIPETSNPGEEGNTWLFGHLESPIRGEGNVFQRLPEIPELLNQGDPVYVSILNAQGDEYLYQITATEVRHQDDLNLYETDESTITLVACVPRLVYDHRILVTGKLVGVKKVV